MGDIADAMLNGELCEMCGVFLDANPPGHPQYCSPQCAKDRNGVYTPVTGHSGRQYDAGGTRLLSQRVKCPTCGKKVKSIGLADHMRDAHEVRPT